MVQKYEFRPIANENYPNPLLSSIKIPLSEMMSNTMSLEGTLDLKNCSEIDQLDSEELGLYIQEKINRISEGGAIRLPPKHIIIRYLYVPKSCKIYGYSETVLEITGAVFVGSFQLEKDEFLGVFDDNDEKIKVSFWELNLKYSSESTLLRSQTRVSDGNSLDLSWEEEKMRMDSNKNSNGMTKMDIGSMFILDSYNSTILEIRDCSIKATKVHEVSTNASSTPLFTKSVFSVLQ